jgi:hypothetical protein
VEERRQLVRHTQDFFDAGMQPLSSGRRLTVMYGGTHQQ